MSILGRYPDGGQILKVICKCYPQEKQWPIQMWVTSASTIYVQSYRGVRRNFGMENFSFFHPGIRNFLFPTQQNWEFCALDQNTEFCNLNE